jgi:GTP-binding protein
MFVDHAKIRVKAGHGGSGCVSFRREKFIPKGGPDGGDGGHGGSVIMQADANMSTLLDFQYRPYYKAERAEHGKGANKHGKNGKDLIIKVPLGTIVRDDSTGEFLGDLTEPGQQVIVARGGRGGKGNARYVSATHQAPREWQQGEWGEEKMLELELKLIADVGLVGLPNAGKSTLISKLSAAKPKIADYPFTTLQPNLGIVRYREHASFVMADIPGIIEGAHTGKGLGIEFLRHIERTRVLLMLIDCNSEDPNADFAVLMKELQEYNSRLPKRLKLIALTKIDTRPDFVVADLEAKMPCPVLPISSVTGAGLDDVKDRIWHFLQAE